MKSLELFEMLLVFMKPLSLFYHIALHVCLSLIHSLVGLCLCLTSLSYLLPILSACIHSIGLCLSLASLNFFSVSLCLFHHCLLLASLSCLPSNAPASLYSLCLSLSLTNLFPYLMLP